MTLLSCEFCDWPGVCPDEDALELEPSGELMPPELNSSPREPPCMYPYGDAAPDIVDLLIPKSRGSSTQAPVDLRTKQTPKLATLLDGVGILGFPTTLMARQKRGSEFLNQGWISCGDREED